MDLQQRIDQTIARVAATADLLPGVIIIHNLQKEMVEYMSPRGLRFLNQTIGELQAMGMDYHHRFFNPEESDTYVPKMLDLLARNDMEEEYTFFQQARIAPDSPWQWYLSAIKILMQDDEGQPLLAINMAQLIDPLNHLTHKVSRLLEENKMLRDHQHIFAALTKKETEVIRMIATGHSSKQIAGALFISDQTAQTHRRNIKAKLGAATDYDITMFAQAFDLI